MDADRRRSDARARRWVLFAFLVVALIPIAGAAVRMGHAGWVPEGDDAMIARRTMSVFSTQPPLTGQPSTAGNLFTAGAGASATKPAAQIDASHPGPLEYYLLALPYRLGAWSPAALLAAVALVNGACVVVAVVFAWRRLGVMGAVAATVAVLVVAERLGTWNLARPLNASIAVLALLAGLVATWAALDGDRWAVVAAVACLSLVIQAHLGAAPLGAVILVLALLGPLALGGSSRLGDTTRLGRRVRSGSAKTAAPGSSSVPPDSAEAAPMGEPHEEVDRPGRAAVATPRADDRIAARLTGTGHQANAGGWWASVAAGTALAVAWVLVAVEQMTAHRGNVGRLVEVARLDVDRAGYRFGLSAVLDRVVEPVWPGVAPLPRISIIGPIALGPVLAKGAVLVAVFAVIAWWARRTDRRWLVRLLAVAVVALLVPMAVLGRGPDEVRLGPTYQLTSLVAVSAFFVFALTAALASAVGQEAGGFGTARPVRRGRRRSRWPSSPPVVQVVGGALAILAVAAVTTTVLGGPTYAEDNHRTARLADAIRAKVPTGTYRLAADGTWAYLSTLDAVSVDLLRHGYDIRVVRLGTIPKEPQRRAIDIAAPTIVIDSTDRPRSDGRLLVRLPPTSTDPTWAGDLLAAVSGPEVSLRFGRGSDRSPCVDQVVRSAHSGDDTPARRRRVVLAILSCSQAERRASLTLVELRGLDQFWVDLLGSNMPAPFPRSGLTAYLVPAP